MVNYGEENRAEEQPTEDGSLSNDAEDASHEGLAKKQLFQETDKSQENHVRMDAPSTKSVWMAPPTNDVWMDAPTSQQQSEQKQDGEQAGIATLIAQSATFVGNTVETYQGQDIPLEMFFVEGMKDEWKTQSNALKVLVQGLILEHNKVKQLEQTLRSSQEVLTQRTEEARVASEQVARLESSMAEQHTQAQAEAKAKDDSIKSLQNDAAQKDSQLSQQASKLSGLEAELSGKAEELKRKTEELEAAKKGAAAADNDLRQLIKGHEATIEADKLAIREHQTTIAQRDATIAANASAMRDLESAKKALTGEKDHLAAELNDKSKALDAEQEAHKKYVADKEKELEDKANELKVATEALSTKMKQSDHEIQELQTKVAALQKERDALTTDLNIARTTTGEQLSKSNALSLELKQTQDQLTQAQQSLADKSEHVVQTLTFTFSGKKHVVEKAAAAATLAGGMVLSEDTGLKVDASASGIKLR